MTDEKYCAHRMLWIVLAATFGCSVHAPEHYAGSVASTAASLSASEFRSDHPRLWMYDTSTWSSKGSQVQNNAQLRSLRDLMRDDADGLLGQPLFNCSITSGNMGRVVQDRVYTFAILGKLLSNQTYTDRAVDELMAAVNERCFTLTASQDLVLAEYAHGIAIGYDWLYDDLTSSERSQVQSLLLEFVVYARDRMILDDAEWAQNAYNWNLVCNGGFGVAALALIHDSSDFRVLDLLNLITQTHKGRGSVWFGLDAYGPSGGWAEGPGYFHYATTYAALLMANLETSRYDRYDLGLSNAPGLSRAGQFTMHSDGPAGLAFNYSDVFDNYSHRIQDAFSGWDDAAPFLSYLARKFTGDTADRMRKYAWDEIGDEIGDGDVDMRPANAAMHIMAYSGTGGSPPDDVSSVQFSDTTFFRSGWESQAAWVGVLAGQNQSEYHRQLDIGSFVFQADGVDWAVELGDDNRNYDDYDNAFRKRTVGHNTIRLDNQEQAQGSNVDAWFETFASQSGAGFTRINMTNAYTPWNVTAAHRGVAMIGYPRNILYIYDRMARNSPGYGVDYEWRMWTKATQYNLSDGDRVIELTRSGKKLRMYLLSPTYAKFTFGSDTNHACDNQGDCELSRTYYRYVSVQTGMNNGTTLKVLFVPESSPHFVKNLSQMEACVTQEPDNCIHSGVGAETVLKNNVLNW